MTTIRLRRGTTTEWDTTNPVLSEGEPGVDLSTGVQKIGNGIDPWSDLSTPGGDVNGKVGKGDLVLNVKDYGALGDGIANDTAAINAAIDAMVPGSILYFPQGRYMTDGGHVIDAPSSTVMGSSGRGQTYNSNAQLYLRNNANADMLTIGANQVTVRNLSLYGNANNQDGAVGTSRGLVTPNTSGANYMLLDAVWCDTFNGDGFYFDSSGGTLSATMVNCESRKNYGYGMQFRGGSTDFIVSDSYIDQNRQSGVYCVAGDIALTNCHIWGNGITASSGWRDGITFASASGCRVSNCYIESQTEGAGIRFASGTNKGHNVNGCDIWNNGFQGIYGYAASFVLIEGNTIRHNNAKGQTGGTGAGVALDNCSAVSIRGNQFFATGVARATYAFYEIGIDNADIKLTGNLALPADHTTGVYLLGPGADLGGPVNVKDFGARGDGIVDDSVAVRAAVALGRTVFFPKGTYLLSRDATNAWALRVATAGQSLTGDGAVLQLAAGIALSVSVLRVEAADVTVAGLTLDGNRANQSVEANAQRHGIFVVNANRLTVRDCTIKNLAGDGILLYTASTDPKILNCRISNAQRDGVSFIAPLDKALIDGCTIEADVQPIDSEPESAGGVNNVTITNNYLDPVSTTEFALTISGFATGAYNENWVVTGNTIMGRVHIYHSNNVLLADNVIDGSAGVPTGVVRGEYGSDRVSIIGNLIKAAGTTHAIFATLTNSEPMTRWKIALNTITVETGRGVSLEGVTTCEVSGNNVVGTGAGFSGLRAESTTAFDRVSFTDNYIEGFTNAIYVNGFAAKNINVLVITGNISKTVTTAINLAGTAASFLSVTIMRNESTGAALTTVVVWVKTGGGGVPTYEGTGVPEAVLAAPVGSLAVRRDGGASTTLYVKQSGTGNTGWVAK